MSPLFPTAPPTVTFSFQQTLTATLSYAKEFQYQEKAVAGIGIPFLTKATVEVRDAMCYKGVTMCYNMLWPMRACDDAGSQQPALAALWPIDQQLHCNC